MDMNLSKLWEIVKDRGALPTTTHGVAMSWTVVGTAAKSLQSCPTLCDPIDGSP